MHWIYLVSAILLEVAGTTSMKLSEGFTKLTPSILMGIFYLASLGALTMVLKTIPVSMAYAVWSGLGTGIIAIIGMSYFGEAVSVGRIFSLLLVIAGVVGLHLTTPIKPV